MRATVACALAGSALVQAATPDQWRSRSIYQVLTDRFARTDGSTSATCNTGDGNYCGGTYRGIIKKLDYIQNMGFSAIWISPITYNIPDRTPYGMAWHGYWQQDLYKLNPNFGTADDLKALSKALHDRGMYLMVDIVVNHNGWNGAASTVNYAKMQPFNDAKYYHPFCDITNYDNQGNVESCWLGDSKVELPDLNTEDSAVVSMYQSWIKGLVGNYSIDGLRIDTVKHVAKSFWKPFNQAAGVFSTGEVYHGDPAYTCPYQQSLDSVLNFPLYYPIIDFLTKSSTNPSRLISGLSAINSACKDPTLLGTFTENHDLPRIGSMTSSTALAKSAIALTILLDGIPIIYAGQEQHYAGGNDPSNREATWLSGYNTGADLYKATAVLNKLRNQAIKKDSGYLKYMAWSIWNDSHTVALRKGFDGNQIITVVTNLGESGGSWTQSVGNTGWASGTQVVEVLTCAKGTVGANGVLSVEMKGGMPSVWTSVGMAGGSGICGL
ncbi:alpha-amylase [Delitschia confertaspora ATCC 74209]|uniref:Alpha-amylase n=1 Tax=Delitschia confertaspora ATCC 74209 TaxID=1513339 RepID=A0A9P4JQH0_9PLEO|nr:alpha-amylase [Delitschia confertaspora ATCC 74209]